MKKYASGGAVRLHTPGHKGALDPLDVTELTDGSFPDAQLAAAESYVAGVYGAKHALLLSCGSSQGVKAAIYFCGGDGIIDINSHRSVRDGFALCGRSYVEAGELGAVRPITAADIKKALRPGIKTAVVTSPTYYGYAADIAGIAELCRREGLLLIADGAHGAHFGASPYLPPRFSHIADICNVSAHKTLFSLNPGAILFDNLKEYDGLRGAAAVMGTTSPSYPVLASVEEGVKRLTEPATAAAYAALYPAVADIKKRYPFLDNDDFTRLVLDCGAVGIDGISLNAALARSGIMSERAEEKRIVFLLTAGDTPSSVEKLDRALAPLIPKK